MTIKYHDLAVKIIEYVGGKQNINNLIHCQTRLRFDLQDDSLANKEELENLQGVAGVINSGGQYQVVIGPQVSEVYEEITELLGTTQSINKTSIEKKKKNIVSIAVEFISTSFSPIIPAMAGAGMIKALLALLVLFNLVSNDSQTYYIVSFMADSVFYFLPFFLASTAAGKLKCNPYLSMALAGILLHPNFATLIADGKAVELFSMPVRLVNYGASVIPILLIVIVQSYIERLLTKIIPDAVKIVFMPMLTIFITGIIALVAVGPIGSYIGELIAMAFNGIRTVAPWAPAVIVGSLLPIMVMFGIHTSIGPLDVIQLTSVGYANIFGPGAMVSNIATGIATLVVSVRTKDKNEKQVSLSAGITALMGITEPALYGVTLPKRYPLVASMIGGGVGGLYAGISGASRFATGSSGLPAIPLYIGEDISNVINIVIAIIITSIITAILTVIFENFYHEKSTKIISASPSANDSGDIIVYSPIVGEMISIEDVKDEVFSTKMLGDGVAFEPSEGKVVSPFDGEIVSLFPTKHAVGIRSNEGMEVLIHVGLNTVELNGKYFESKVSQGDKVTKGQELLEFDFSKLKEEGYVTQVPVVITNSNEYRIDTYSSLGNKNFNDVVMMVHNRDEGDGK